MAATDARPVPIKNAAFRVTFTILDADGDPLQGATGLSAVISKDAAAAVDCANLPVAIAGAGFYYLDLTAAEMNADTVAVRVTQTANPNGKNTVLVMYPQESGDIKVEVQNVAANALNAAALAADAVAEIQTGLASSAQVAAVQADVDDVQSRLPAGLTPAGNMRSDAQAIDGSAEAADRLQRSAETLCYGVVGAASTTTSVVTSSLSPPAVVAQQFKGRILLFARDTATAALRGQATEITASTAAGVLTVASLTTAPSSGDTFTIA